MHLSTEEDEKKNHRSMGQGTLTFVKLLPYKRRGLIFDMKIMALARRLICGRLKQKHPLALSGRGLQAINSRVFYTIEVNFFFFVLLIYFL